MGRVTETSQEDTTETAQHLRDTVGELTSLKDEQKQLKVTRIAAINTQRPRPRSPIPHRVTFANPTAQPAIRPAETPYYRSAPVSFPRHHLRSPTTLCRHQTTIL